MKRFLVCVLMLGLLLTLLCACADGQSDERGTSGDTGESSMISTSSTGTHTGDETTTGSEETEIPKDEQFAPSQDDIDENWTPNY